MKKYIFILLIFLFHFNIVFGCSCSSTLIDLPVGEMGWTTNKTDNISSFSDLIFTGIFVGYSKVNDPNASNLFNESYEMCFKLLKKYKGWAWDTIKIRTNLGQDACGFTSKLNSECLIFAKMNDKGFFYTFNSMCCKSISKSYDEKRFNKYINFLESITNMIDGDYVFYQSKAHMNGGIQDTVENLEAIRYSIKNGKFEGVWQLKDRFGRILEKGEYKNGKKVGKWTLLEGSFYFNKSFHDKTETIKYRNGFPIKSKILVLDREEMFDEINLKIWFKTNSIQTIKSRYKYPKQKG
jgi:hypothetical protein